MADGSISVSICKNVSYVRVGWVVFLTSTPRMKLVQLLSWRAANSHPSQILQHVRIGYNPVETANVKNETEPPPPKKTNIYALKLGQKTCFLLWDGLHEDHFVPYILIHPTLQKWLWKLLENVDFMKLKRGATQQRVQQQMALQL